jgi:hypothetical protein
VTSKFYSPQEEFWATEFGDAYISRNQSAKLLASNVALFGDVFSSIDSVPQTFLEVGANIGMNVKAIQTLSPEAHFTGIEINKQACEILAETGCHVVESSILDANITTKFDFVFSKGVLIHLAPEQLQSTYRKMYEWSSRFILIAEYYNPVPVAISYRGNVDKLFKRDFAGEFLDLFEDVKLRDFGFAYHRGKFPQDDINWFLLEKTSSK